MYISKTILFCLVAAMLLYIGLFTCNHIGPPQLQDETEQVVPSEWINDAGDIVSSLTGSEEAFARAKKDIIDSLAKVYNTKPKNIIEYIILEAHGSDDIRPDGPTAADYFPVDTTKNCPPEIKSLRKEFKSPYYRASVRVSAPGGEDSSYMHLMSFDTVTVLWKKVKEGSIFNRRSLIQLDVSTANPNTRVSGIKAYRIYEKPKRWAIGLQVGYGITAENITKPYPMISVGVTRTLIRF